MRAAVAGALGEPRVIKSRPVPWLGRACGGCRCCVGGRENLCEDQINAGYGVDGAYAEYLVADAKFAVPVPPGVSALDVAPSTCAGVTSYAAVKTAIVLAVEGSVFGLPSEVAIARAGSAE